jgi:translocation and assembly module TamA
MPRRFPARGPLLALLLLLAACAGGNGDEPIFDEGDDAESAIPYDVRVEGDLPPELRSLLLAASGAEQLRSRPPASELILRRRATADVATLERALQSQGYYDGRVSFGVTSDPTKAGTADSSPLTLMATPATRIAFTVEQGRRYVVSGVRIQAVDADAEFRTPTPDEVRLATGSPATAQSVLDAEQELLVQTRRQARPLARLGQRTTIIDRATGTMEITLRIEPGPPAVFGEITFDGRTDVRDNFLRKRLPFQSGDPYDPELVERGRRRLIETNLFATVRVMPGTELDENGRIPIAYEVNARRHRTIGGSVGYETDTGANARVYWEHRNVFREGERLRTELDVGQTEQKAQVDFRKPDMVPGLSLIAGLVAGRSETDAYDSSTIRGSTGLEYQFTERVLATGSVSYRYADIDDDGDRQRFGLISFPGQADWDFSDNLLDPTRGGRVSLFGAPYTNTIGSPLTFAKAQLTHTRYLPLLDEHRLVLALRGSLGAMDGASRADIPADERFYAGGGGSVRGVAYQLAGPVDSDENPLGGRSLAEFSVEFRSRFTESIGGVAFLDGGTVYDSPVPDFSGTMRLGTGLGLRYITGIGPVRLDVGVPVNPRDFDDPYQIYVSIGQAF